MNWRILIATTLCMVGVALPSFAESAPPFLDFEAKRVKPPKPGQRKRITVQIEPHAPQVLSPSVQSTSTAVSAPVGQSYDWFWETVSPDITATGPGRLEPALVRLSNPPHGKGVRSPRLGNMQAIIDAHGVDILLATVGTEVSPALAAAVIAVESGGRAEVVSGAGAQGLMQLMPATAERFGVTEAMDVQQNIAGGVRFLDFLMKKFEHDPILVLAGYNAGENAVTNHNGVPPYAETRDYVPKVLAAFNVARALCVTPPQLVSDGCVFRRH
ncbi:lytic transglycosylase domain-containing protein [Shimia abyssi]|uniref:Transglycosylase-like protein with SLT domain n=1 Tax=Shimia abyssi TaxID=1662395 RepID=A0A2P8FKV6_9RHOB|nr:transglycosylase SLT domain-containing protein [Shimia abyssi]PSL22374.1 transglycosylase-like protein with SLT domain [Shimia abyssi]